MLFIIRRNSDRAAFSFFSTVWGFVAATSPSLVTTFPTREAAQARIDDYLAPDVAAVEEVEEVSWKTLAKPTWHLRALHGEI